MTKTMMAAGLWILTLGMPLTTAHAQSADRFTANELVRECEAVDKVTATTDDGWRSLTFLGYFAGWMDATSYWSILGPLSQIFCLPQHVTVGQMRMVFLKYMADHPEQLHIDRAKMTALALQLAFPCNR